MLPNRTKEQRWFAAALPFTLLCLLTSSRWILEGAYPEVHSSFLTQTVGCLLAGSLIGCGYGAMHRRRINAIPPNWRICLAGSLVVSGPAMVSVVSSRHVSGENATLAFALTPIVVAVASSVFSEAAGEDLIARLWPGLASLSGLLLLLPQPAVSNWRLDLALLGMPLIAGVSAAYVGGHLFATQTGTSRTSGWLPWEVCVLGLAAIIFGSLAGRSVATGAHPDFSMKAAGLDGMSLWLTLVVLGRLGAVRWSAQFLVVPLITLLEGVVLLRPVLGSRSWLALGLLLLSSGYLLLADPGKMSRLDLRS